MGGGVGGGGRGRSFFVKSCRCLRMALDSSDEALCSLHSQCNDYMVYGPKESANTTKSLSQTTLSRSS